MSCASLFRAKLRIADEREMFAPAMMIKITAPCLELYELNGISDEELRAANNKFILADLPFRVCRKAECALHQVAA